MKRLVGLLLALLATATPAWGYIEVPYTLGRVLQESTHIMVVQVEKVNKERRLIYYKKIADLKGKHPGDVVKHIINNGFHPREPKFIMDWAAPGKTAIFFHNGGASETCIGDYWYQCYPQGEWWGMSHAEPYLRRSFCGSTEKLRSVVIDMLAGKEVVVPCAQFDPAKMQHYNNLCHEKKCPLWRRKASLKILDYNTCLREKNKYVVGLGALGPEAVPGFIADLKKPDATVRLKAVIELGQIGEEAKAALAALGESLKDTDSEVRIRSAEALVRIDPKSQAAIPALIEALQDEKLRAATIDILGSVDPPAKATVTLTPPASGGCRGR